VKRPLSIDISTMRLPTTWDIEFGPIQTGSEQCPRCVLNTGSQSAVSSHSQIFHINVRTLVRGVWLRERSLISVGRSSTRQVSNTLAELN